MFSRIVPSELAKVLEALGKNKRLYNPKFSPVHL